ncbi:MAG: NUDIX domain-containing protein [Candidatus Nanopelagicales bacterium]|nr:NUDIX domain-containing protein [Candidatus Nanopelagicales bacterium]
MAATDRIVAAGAVVTRAGKNEIEFLLIFRKYRGDWTFPKGKVDPGEHLLTAAVREVREETGFAVSLGVPLPTQTYEVDGLRKDSHYWVGQRLAGEFVPNDEVDEIAWLSFEQAKAKLTYEHDQEVLAAAANSIPTIPLIVLRHTQSVKRGDWLLSSDALSEADTSRPLTAVGRMQANSLVGALAAFGVAELHSSDSRRCRDTVGPYATGRSLPVVLEKTVSEERHKDHPERAIARVKELAEIPRALVLCTHRPVLPAVMEALSSIFTVENETKKTFDPAFTPGTMVVYHRDATNLRQIVSVERHQH